MDRICDENSDKRNCTPLRVRQFPKRKVYLSMYEGKSFGQQYAAYCEREKRRRGRLHRLTLAAALVVGAAVLVFILSDKILPIEVWATAGQRAVELDLGGITQVTAKELAQESSREALVSPGKQAPVKSTPVIYIDAGHGGNDGGCFEGGVMEKNINLSIAKLVRDQLKKSGYEVIMSRSTDTYIAKEDRVRKANSAGADIYVSIHQNASEVRSVGGMEVWYDGTDSQRDSRRLALLISQQTTLSTGAVEREVRGDADFHVTGSTQMPACLIETGFLSNKKERAKLTSQEYQEQIAAGIVQGIEYYFHPKIMYLTFDDGPSRENTPRVLDILKERGIKATFFLVGENVEWYPEIAQRIVAEGHSIGIHCYNHDYETLYQSVESYIEDFEHARRVIYDATGVDTVLFRFPGGSINSYNGEVCADIIEEMTKKGYLYYDWNASLEDAAADVQPDRLLANGVQTTLGRRKVIMLAHDVVFSTGMILEELLDQFPEYEMRPLTEDIEPIHFKNSSAVG